MVERKKTGLAKARKAVSKRCCLAKGVSSQMFFFSMHGSNARTPLWISCMVAIEYISIHHLQYIIMITK